MGRSSQGENVSRTNRDQPGRKNQSGAPVDCLYFNGGNLTFSKLWVYTDRERPLHQLSSDSLPGIPFARYPLRPVAVGSCQLLAVNRPEMPESPNVPTCVSPRALCFPIFWHIFGRYPYLNLVTNNTHFKTVYLNTRVVTPGSITD